MPSKLGTWLIVGGALLAVAGLLVMPAAAKGGADRNLLGVGASVFSLGLLAASGGLYLKASALKQTAGGKSAKQPADAKPARGGCDRCHQNTPVILCKVHQQHLCGDCLAEHYDFRSCVYTPSSRKNGVVRTMAARAR